MVRPSCEVADIINEFFKQDGASLLNPYQLKTLSAIARCRTAALGGHVDECDTCGHLRISYNSCRNRHCPKCQGINKEMWIIQQEDMLLPVAYYHVVFTLPHELNVLCMLNPKQMYDLLFSSAWYTLNTFAQDRQWLGATTGATMILHTWSQTLGLHPHLHCIVPNGGLTKQGNWQFPKKGKQRFLFPVAAMKKVYRGYLIKQLKQMIAQDELQIPIDYFMSYGGMKHWKDVLYSKDWVLYTKKPFSKTKHVIDYLGRYSHRVAITNPRITHADNHSTSFVYKDYRQGAKKKMMTVELTEFIRRFCLHLLPPFFRKIRSYGLFANACKAKCIRLARLSLGVKHTALLSRHQRKAVAIDRLFGQKSLDDCPVCKMGKLKMIIALNLNKPPPEDILNKIHNQNI